MKPEIGDFVKGKHGFPIGFVRRFVTIPYGVGKRRIGIPSVEVETASGKREVIPIEDVIRLNDREGFRVSDDQKSLKSAKHKARTKFAQRKARTKITSGAFVTAVRRTLTNELRELERGALPQAKDLQRVFDFLFHKLNAYQNDGGQFRMWVTSATEYVSQALRIVRVSGWSDKRGATAKVAGLLSDAIVSLSSADDEWAKLGRQAQHQQNTQGKSVKLSGNAKVAALRRTASQMLSRLARKEMPTSMEIDKLRTYIDRNLNSDPQLIGVGFNAKIAANHLFHANTYPAMRAALVDLISICSEFDAGGLQAKSTKGRAEMSELLTELNQRERQLLQIAFKYPKSSQAPGWAYEVQDIHKELRALLGQGVVQQSAPLTRFIGEAVGDLGKFLSNEYRGKPESVFLLRGSATWLGRTNRALRTRLEKQG